MFKKILSLAIVAVLLMSVMAVSFSAAQVEIADDAADASAIADQGAADSEAAGTGADASDAAATGAGSVIKYDNSVTNWAGPVQFYVYNPKDDTDKPFGEWGSKALNGTDEGNNIWSYDASALGDGQYCIIFADKTSGDQTYDLMLDKSCIGDTAKATGESVENPVDSKKTCKVAKWASSSLGPRKQVTSIGNVIGETPVEEPYDMFVSFLKNTLENARQYSGKDDQKLIDDTAAALGLSKDDVEKAISEAGVTTEWKASASSLSGGSSGGGSDDKKDSSSSSSSSSGGSSGSSGSSGSGSSSTKSGSASNTQTGQTETVIFIMLGVMVAAAGVIFFARKKDRA